MSAQIIDGKKIAQEIREEVSREVQAFAAQGITPGLATILVGDDPGSQVYVRNKQKIAGQLGIYSEHHPLPATSTQKEVTSKIEELNDNPKIHAILCQLPLPDGLDPGKAIETIAPHKDVDGFHPVNLGKLLSCKKRSEIDKLGIPVPCTPLGIMELIHRSGIEVSGKHAVVVGRSNIVGKPVALLLMSENATVTICHSRTEGLPDIVREADIVVAAIGKPRYVQSDWVKPGACVIDVGINRTDSGLVGDVDFDNVKEVAGWLTPVPGGVGPMTIAMLMKSTVQLAERQNGRN